MARVKKITRPRNISLTSFIGLFAFAAPAGAEIDQTAHFEVARMVVVWAADENGNASIVSDFIVYTGAGSTDLMTGDAYTVTTGTLDPVSGTGYGAAPEIRGLGSGGNLDTDTNTNGTIDTGDSFSPFQIDAGTDYRVQGMELTSSFYVASNAPFSISAQSRLVSFQDLINLLRVRATMQVTPSGNDGVAFGSAAQFPHSGGATGGISLTNDRLSTLLSPRLVFQGNRRTAAAPGSLADHSVRFDVAYRMNGTGTVDLSDGVFETEAEVTYTVFLP